MYRTIAATGGAERVICACRAFSTSNNSVAAMNNASARAATALFSGPGANLLRRCHECGQPLGKKDLFCPRCGAKQPRQPKVRRVTSSCLAALYAGLPDQFSPARYLGFDFFRELGR